MPEIQARLAAVAPPATETVAEKPSEKPSEKPVAVSVSVASPPSPAPGARQAPRQFKALPSITLYYDPAVSNVHRQLVANLFSRMLLTIEMYMTLDAALTQKEATATETASSGTDQLPWKPGELLTIHEQAAGKEKPRVKPTSVQQNVPAWTLFAMFMIAIPLANNLIRERSDGTRGRLRCLPVSPFTQLFGKILVYMGLCFIQFGIMLIIGSKFLPLLGTPDLVLGGQYEAILVATGASAMAATGYGLMIGAIARTNDQASFFGAISTIIAGALGGIMVPVFMMPEAMQAVSVYSPLNWGLNAYLDIFLREATIGEILPNLGKLIAFFIASLSVSMFFYFRSE